MAGPGAGRMTKGCPEPTGQPRVTLEESSTSRPGTSKALGTAGIPTPGSGAELRPAGLFQTAPEPGVGIPISGPEPAFVVRHG